MQQDLRGRVEDDDDTNLHNKTFDVECVIIDENDEAVIEASETES